MRFAAFSALILVSVAGAQVSSSVGPPVAPIGCPVSISVSNDTNSTYFTSYCPFVIRDSGGTTIFTPFCIAIVNPIAAGSTFTTYWAQNNDSGLQVPPGTYFVDVFISGATQSTPVVIGGADAAVSILGVPRIGTQRNLRLCSPGDGGFTFGMAAALSSVGISTCAGIVPLDTDPLFFLSLDPSNPFFIGFTGALDNTGISETPSLNVPNVPAIVGQSFVLAFVTVDFSQPCPVRTISAPTSITIQ